MGDRIDNFDVVILGGGPGGISAGIWCADLGLRSIVLERRSEFGGQLLRIYNPITNYPGIETQNGRDLHDRFMQQFERRDVSARMDLSVKTVDIHEKSVTTEDGEVYKGNTLIIATGVRRRKLEIPGEMEFAGRGILESGAKDREQVEGKTVLIVGGGDAAMENALILSDSANEVFVAHRRHTASAREHFLLSARKRKNVRFLPSTVVHSIEGNERVRSVELEDSAGGIRRRMDVDAILIRIGALPNSEEFIGELRHNAAGYIHVDSQCRTSVSGVYAIGDVASPVSPTICTAVGMGATAAKAIRKSSEL